MVRLVATLFLLLAPCAFSSELTPQEKILARITEMSGQYVLTELSANGERDTKREGQISTIAAVGIGLVAWQNPLGFQAFQLSAPDALQMINVGKVNH